MAARLRTRIVALDALGNVRASATVKFFVKGTATASGATASGTPFAGNLYAAVTGGSPVSTTQTADANGQVIVYTDTPERFDVGVEATGVNARVFTYEPMELDPSDAKLGLIDSGGGTAGAPVDMASYDGAKRYGAHTVKIYTQNYVSAVARETFAIIGHNVHQTGEGGYATGVYGRAEFPTGHATLTSENGAIGVLGEALAPASGVAGVFLRGGNLRAVSYNTANDAAAGVFALELNVRADANVEQRAGISVSAVGESDGTAGTGDGTGAEIDAGVAIASKRPAVAFAHGVAFPRPSHTGTSTGIGFGVSPTGSILFADGRNLAAGTDSTVARGIDFRNITFTTSAWESTNFVVAANGDITAAGSLVATNDVALTGSGKRLYIRGSGTVGNRTLVIDTLGSDTDLGVIPASGRTQASVTAFNNNAPGSGQYIEMLVDATAARINSSSNSGNSKDLYLSVGGTSRAVIERATSDFKVLLGELKMLTSDKALEFVAQSTGHLGGVKFLEGSTRRNGMYQDNLGVQHLGDPNNSLRVKTAGIAFFDTGATVTPVGRQTIGTTATTLSEVLGLANSIRTALINLNLATT